MLSEIFNIYVLVEAIYLILPAYAANGLVPLFRGSHPVDGGRKLVRHRLFGEGKTWEGLFAGMVIGAVIALVEQLAFPYLPWGISDVPLTIVPMTVQMGLLLGLGAMIGDLGGSFIKRRFGLKRGTAAPLLDQEDFLIGSLLFASVLVAVGLVWWIMLLVITPIIHLAANAIGYIFKVKKTPY
jgi:CDP-2,3-bis-(O-geranylgeranyl)-sn-glycerol synthase